VLLRANFAEFVLVFLKGILLNQLKSLNDAFREIHCLLNKEYPLIFIDLMVVAQLGKDSLTLTNYGEDHLEIVGHFKFWTLLS
jgi:hypothetical protein